jgi:hypothetical protein
MVYSFAIPCLCSKGKLRDWPGDHWKLVRDCWMVYYDTCGLGVGLALNVWMRKCAQQRLTV